MVGKRKGGYSNIIFQKKSSVAFTIAVTSHDFSVFFAEVCDQRPKKTDRTPNQAHRDSEDDFNAALTAVRDESPYSRTNRTAGLPFLDTPKIKPPTQRTDWANRGRRRLGKT